MGIFTLLRRAVDALAQPFGYRLEPIKSDRPIGRFDPAHQAIIERVRPYTMTSDERIAATCAAVDHVIKYEIPGDFVECGVWRGGSTMAAALSFMRAGYQGAVLHLFDTFEGMPPPGSTDSEITSGATAASLLAQSEKSADVWAIAAIDDVRRNLLSTGYPADRVRVIKGKVEDTIPAEAPKQIAVLRLDTDWYESTRHELEHLFPRLSPGGVLIIDDYGHWEGARRAVDEYFSKERSPMLLARTDYTGRIGVKLAGN